MPDIHEQSLINLAESVLAEKKQPMDLYELFDTVLEKSNAPAEDIVSLLQMFYTDLTSSAKFTYMGENTWDLKRHQKVDLWEKDGSFYNEYTEVEDPVLDERIAAAEEVERKHQEMLERREVEAEAARAKAEAEALAEAQAEEAAAEAKATEPIAEEPVEATDVEPLETEETPPAEAKEPIEIELVEVDTDKVKEDTEKAKEDTGKAKEDAEVDEDYEGFDEEKYHEYMDTYEDEYDK